MPNSLTHAPWAINLVLKIDAASPGFCGAFLRGSDEKRQVIAAFLSACPAAAQCRAEPAEFLLTANHGAILSRAFGGTVQGLRGALRRAGPTVHEERFYGVLQRLLSRPRHGEITKCISRLSALDFLKLRVANILPESLCRSNVVEGLSISAAHDLVTSFNLLISAGADETGLASVIRTMRDEAGLARILGRAMLNCRGAEHPVPSTDSYRPIQTARELHKVAAKFRNCARNYTIDLLDGDAGHAFAEVRLGKDGAVAHLRRREGRWTLEGLFGPRNGPPSRTVQQYVSEHLRKHGVEPRARYNVRSAWAPVRRIASTHFLEFDLV